MATLAFNAVEIGARAAEAGPARARRHLPADDRGALQALSGVCREAERDPRQARGRRCSDRANQVYSELRALKIDLSFAVGGIKNHEIYFEHLGGDGGDPEGPIATLVRRDFGSIDAWRNDLKATGMAGRGWAWTAYDWDEGRLFNYLGDAQNTFPIWNATPLVALDVYEHAYFLDFQTDRASYIDAFFANLDWNVVNGWIEGYGIRAVADSAPMTTAILVAAGYLIGSIPFGYWLVRATKGVDIRSVGSGNIGASNVWRTYGWRFGVPVMLFDTAKGFVPALVATEIAGPLAGVLAGAGAMLGHARPLFLGFAKGGKTVATAGGAFLGLAPIVGLLGAAVWIVTFLVTRYASIASIAGACSLPLLAWAFGEPVAGDRVRRRGGRRRRRAPSPEHPSPGRRHGEPRPAVARGAAPRYCSSGAIVRPESLSSAQ